MMKKENLNFDFFVFFSNFTKNLNVRNLKKLWKKKYNFQALETKNQMFIIYQTNLSVEICIIMW